MTSGFIIPGALSLSYIPAKTAQQYFCSQNMYSNRGSLPPQLPSKCGGELTLPDGDGTPFGFFRKKSQKVLRGGSHPAPHPVCSEYHQHNRILLPGTQHIETYTHISWQLLTLPCVFRVPSAQPHFTSGFGMGPGSSTAPSHHYIYVHVFFNVRGAVRIFFFITFLLQGPWMLS